METKICTTCGRELEATTENFHKAKAGKLGLAAKCKECKTKQIADWGLTEAGIRSHKVSTYRREAASKPKRYLTEIEKVESLRNRKAKYRRTEKGKLANRVTKALYRARAETKLTDEEHSKVKEIYAEMKRLNKDAGYIAYHVDHIIPVVKGGKTHPDNLQIMRAIHNLKKGGK